MSRGTTLRVGATFLATMACLLVGLAQASYGVEIFEATLSGANETPPNASPATGSATVTLNADMLSVFESFANLEAPATAAHIHCCTPPGLAAAVAVPFPGFPSATSGTYNQTFDLTQAATYTGGFITANGGTAATAEVALETALESGQTYVNIHDSLFPGGEIRGQLHPVPEPASLLMVGLGGLALKRSRWMRRR